MKMQKVLLIALFLFAAILLPITLYFSDLWAFLVVVGLVFLTIIAIFIVHRRSFPPERQKELQVEAERIARDDSTPIAAELIDTYVVTGKSTFDAATRGFVGDALFGTIGAVIGITTAKEKVKEHNATFSVKYKSGRIGIETVPVGSDRYYQLMALSQEE
jgi:hypothetical protein